MMAARPWQVMKEFQKFAKGDTRHAHLQRQAAAEVQGPSEVFATDS
jgi:hypothetical protein